MDSALPETKLPHSCPLCGADVLKGPKVWHDRHANAEYWCGTSAGDNLEGHMWIQYRGQHCTSRQAGPGTQVQGG